MKKSIVVFLFVFFIGCIPSYASELPYEFWGFNDKYAAAVKQGDNHKIIEYGMRLVELAKSIPSTHQTDEIIGSRLDQVGLAYERLGQYISAGECYCEYIPYAERLGWSDGVKIARAKVLQYTPVADIYTAKEKPRDRVLFGAASDGEIRKSLPNETMILVYIEFGDTYFSWLELMLKQAREGKKTVEIALNLPNEADDLKTVMQSEGYILSLLELVEKYSDVNVLLRFGAEMNIWNRVANPDDYISAFRMVHRLVKEHTSNTKTVWSVNQVSSWNINMDDYYPGDEYVDYVGVSAYVQKYFLGRNDWSEAERFNEIVFLTGKSADPVKALTEVISRYGAIKPVILAESGVSHYVNTLGEDTTDWALLNLKKMYYYVPMVYPQVKMIAYFDKSVPNEVNEYSLGKNQALAKAYKELTTLPSFRGNLVYESLEQTRIVEQKPQEIYSYVHIYGRPQPTVDYYIDGVFAASSSDVPYSANIDFSKYPQGTHSLGVVVREGDTKLFEKTYDINIVPRVISVFVNGNKLLFDTDPVLTPSDRVLVPMRAVFEALGAQIEWDAATETVTAKSGKTTIKVQIGSSTMLKNGSKITLDAVAALCGDRTLVPVRAVSEALGATVMWDGENSSVLISD
ncbi:MAG: hypothetical protein BWY15_00376 [Firmicutes bacterium ADurb.Bin193]|nr:MAG: hypothetical protein BWY15_00376 [Firmicutes bacterium ADurb.Bin193]